MVTRFCFLSRSSMIDFDVKCDQDTLPDFVRFAHEVSLKCWFWAFGNETCWRFCVHRCCPSLTLCLMKLSTLHHTYALLQYAYSLVYLGLLMDVIYMRVQWCKALAWGVWHPAGARSRLWWPLYLQDYLLVSDVGAGGLCASVEPSRPAVPSSVCISDVGPLKVLFSFYRHEHHTEVLSESILVKRLSSVARIRFRQQKWWWMSSGSVCNGLLSVELILKIKGLCLDKSQLSRFCLCLYIYCVFH